MRSDAADSSCSMVVVVEAGKTREWNEENDRQRYLHTIHISRYV